MSEIPFSVRDKNVRINAITGMNFEDTKINRLIKKIDENNAGNSNISNLHTATGSKTTFLSGDPDDIFSIIGGVIETETTGFDREMTLSVTNDHILKIFNNNPIGVTGGFDCLDGDINVNSGDINALVGTVTAQDVTATGNLTGTLATASQPTITSVGTLTSLTSSGNITTTTGTVSALNVTATGVLTGTLASGAQPNITTIASRIDLSVANRVKLYNSTTLEILNSHNTNTQSTFFNHPAGSPRVNYIRGTTEFSQDAFFSGSITGTLASGTQPNITNIASRIDLSQSSKVIINNSTELEILNTDNQKTHFNIPNQPWINYIRGHTEFTSYVFFRSGSSAGSDDRLKHNEQIITNGLSVMSQLTPKKYDKSQVLMDANYNGPLEEGEYIEEAGLIAQELLETDISFVVKIPEDLEIDPYGVDYNSVFTYAIAAIKELHVLVQSQATTINELQVLVQSHATTIKEIKKNRHLKKIVT